MEAREERKGEERTVRNNQEMDGKAGSLGGAGHVEQAHRPHLQVDHHHNIPISLPLPEQQQSPSTMTEPSIQVAETVQTASVKRNPSAAHDVNPPTAANPDKKQVPESAISDTDSIPSDVVDPSRMVRTVVRRRNLPPLPDLRFEQSYLASLKDADTWGRVAWITVRDQVLSTAEQERLRRSNEYLFR